MSEDAEAFETRTESHQGEISIHLAGRELESLSAVKTNCVLFGIFAVMCAACATTTTAPTPPPTSAPLTAPVAQPSPPVGCPPPGPEAKFMALQPGERHAAGHVGPDYLYPSRDLTPGLAATL